ncbi:hypothetical protein [Hyphococcus sp.]|uniref:hypothetical protein n=1 Tax=Hyphococcus sp. TaxID=2038636 RepID=UPI0035C70BB2
MFRYKVTGLSFFFLGAACATAPQAVEKADIVNPYEYFAFDRPSRIEIAQNLTIRSASLDQNPTVLSASSNNDASMDAHERAVQRETTDSDRLRNKALSTGGHSYYVPAQNSFDQDGWAVEGARLRHVESGLLCPSGLALGDEGRTFGLERVTEFSDDGRDVGCQYRAADNGDLIVAYASYWPDVELEAHAAAAAQSIMTNYAVESQVTLPVVDLQAEDADADMAALINGIEEPLAGGFEIGAVNGVPYRTSLWIVKTHGWHVKLRATYASADQSSELLSAIHFMASHLSVRAKNLAEPITAGAEV